MDKVIIFNILGVGGVVRHSGKDIIKHSQEGEVGSEEKNF
jgi:hypothetical protein